MQVLQLCMDHGNYRRSVEETHFAASFVSKRGGGPLASPLLQLVKEAHPVHCGHFQGGLGDGVP